MLVTPNRKHLSAIVTAVVGAFAMTMMTMLEGSLQLPGDRPAQNPRSTRSVVMGRHGMIATSQPLASAAGLRVLQDGGNAIDAAVAAAGVLSVVEPTMNGIGGDLFAIVFNSGTGKLDALNASGRSAYAATRDVFVELGLEQIPGRSILSVSVPGVVDGWAELLNRHGTMSLSSVLTPAIQYAREGFPVSEIISEQWRDAETLLVRDAKSAETFLLDGRAPVAGSIFSNPRLAVSLEIIAKGGRDAFYHGEIAKAIVADIQRRKGLLTERDFSEHRSNWVEPISTTYRGYEVFEMPPNTQGITALEMLNILEGFDLQSLEHNSAAYLHLLIEAKRIAFADRDAYVADPDSVPLEVVKNLLSKDYAKSRRNEINTSAAVINYAPAVIDGTYPVSPSVVSLVDSRDLGDTVYLTVADGEGNVISLIQSIFSNFGSGLVAGDTGIALHNRGSLFTLQPDHPNTLEPHKRPLHTLIPAMVLKDGRPWLSFGVMGGGMQPQGHVQVLLNLIDFGMNIQEAGETARFRHSESGVALESAIGAEVRFGLNQLGHQLITNVGAFGGFQGILIDPEHDVLMGGSDPRKDGLAIGY